MDKHIKEKRSLQIIDGSALLLSVWFVYSVISNARDLIEQNIKNAPASYALIVAMGLIVYSWRVRRKLSILNVIVITILMTSIVIWLFGLSSKTSLI